MNRTQLQPAPKSAATKRAKRAAPPESDSALVASAERAQKLCGSAVRIWWDNEWYSGTIVSYDVETGEHTVRYDDSSQRSRISNEERFANMSELGDTRQELHADEVDNSLWAGAAASGWRVIEAYANSVTHQHQHHKIAFLAQPVPGWRPDLQAAKYPVSRKADEAVQAAGSTATATPRWRSPPSSCRDACVLGSATAARSRHSEEQAAVSAQQAASAFHEDAAFDLAEHERAKDRPAHHGVQAAAASSSSSAIVTDELVSTLSDEISQAEREYERMRLDIETRRNLLERTKAMQRTQQLADEKRLAYEGLERSLKQAKVDVHEAEQAAKQARARAREIENDAKRAKSELRAADDQLKQGYADVQDLRSRLSAPTPFV